MLRDQNAKGCSGSPLIKNLRRFSSVKKVPHSKQLYLRAVEIKSTRRQIGAQVDGWTDRRTDGKNIHALIRTYAREATYFFQKRQDHVKRQD